MPRIPSLPRVPGMPDPLRRIRLPTDLDAVTSAGPEVAAEAGGLDPEAVERIWSAAGALYRSPGVRAARRSGRAGPGDRARPWQWPARRRGRRAGAGHARDAVPDLFRLQ